MPLLQFPEVSEELFGLRILVVEDEPETRELVCTALDERGADVIGAPTAEAAFGLFVTYAPHVLVSDLELPGSDGCALIRRVRGVAGGRELAAIALSASASAEDARRALAAGFDVHVAKPITVDELAEAVRSVTLSVPARAAVDVL